MTTLIISAALFLGRLLGLLKEVVLAPIFGAGVEMDALVAARTLPELALTVLSAGALRAVMVPALARASRDRGGTAALHEAECLGSTLLLASLVVMVLGLLFPGALIRSLAVGLSPQAMGLGIPVLRLLLLALVLQVFAGVVGAILNFKDRFTVPSLSAAFINGAIVFATLLTWRRFGIAAVAMGWLVGSAAHAAASWMQLRGLGLRVRLLRPSELMRGLRALLPLAPILLVQSLIYSRMIVERQFVSGLPEGALAVLNYSNRVVQVPLNIFANAFVISLLPAFSRALVSSDPHEAPGVLRDGTLRLLRSVAFPVAVLLVLGLPTVRLLFQRGAFTPEAAVATAELVRIFAVGLIPASFLGLWSQYHFAKGSYRVPAVALLVGLGLQVSLSFALLGAWGVRGVVAASVAGMTASAVLLGRGVITEIRGAASTGRIVAPLGATSLGAVAAAVVMAACWRWASVGGAAVPGWAAYGGVVLLGGALFAAALGVDARLRRGRS